MNFAGKLWERAYRILPREVFFFDRPLVLLHSDDWGRAGLRDRQGFEQLRASGLDLGQRPYDLYTLETAADVRALSSVLGRHRDASGRPPVLVMNFVLANLDIPHGMNANSMPRLLPLADGLPAGWSRPELFDAYREGIEQGIFYPAFHGISHFCRSAVERHLRISGERAALLETLWKAGTPYIYWRMPWIGYEYWDPEQPSDAQFLARSAQQESIGHAVGLFARVFSSVPRSACAPGYRANSDTQRGWSKYGIKCAQNGPSGVVGPHMDRHHVLQIYRNIEFEPAVVDHFSVEKLLRIAESCFTAKLPAVVSMHSINFHSTVKDFRSRTLLYLDEFLTALETRYPNLLYIQDEDLYNLIQTGCFRSIAGRNRVGVTKRRVRRPIAAEVERG